MSNNITITERCNKFATQLMQEYSFKTTRDNNEFIYVFDKDQGIYTNNAGIIIEERGQTFLGDECDDRAINTLRGSIKRQTFLKENEDFDQYENLICVNNGVLNIDTRELIDWNSKYLFLRKIPVYYHSKADCPLFKKTLTEVVNKLDVTTIQEFIGYTLYPDNRLKRMLIEVGRHDTGKSTINELIRYFLGGQTFVSSLTLQDLDTIFRPAELLGKMANICNELDKDGVKHVSRIKELTGGVDTVTVERKNEHPFQLKSRAKFIFACNDIPLAPTADDAFYSRCLIIDYPHQFVKGNDMDENLHLKLRTEEEMSGILNFALDGYQNLKKNHGFTYDTNTEEKKVKYLGLTGNTVCKFISEHIVYEPETIMAKDNVYEFYKSLCSQNSVRWEVYQEFFRQLEQLLGNKVKIIRRGTGDREWALQGIGLK